MKKVFSIMLAAVLCVGLCACGGEEDTESTQAAVTGTIIASDEVTAPEETTVPAETTSPDEIVIAEESTVSEETAPELVDGMRPAFKEAMDSYEAFYNEYCDFMKEYSENPSDLTLLAKYSELMAKAVEVDEAFEKWDEGEMNDAELKYYLEVSNRVMQKLVELTG